MDVGLLLSGMQTSLLESFAFSGDISEFSVRTKAGLSLSIETLTSLLLTLITKFLSPCSYTRNGPS